MESLQFDHPLVLSSQGVTCSITENYYTNMEIIPTKFEATTKTVLQGVLVSVVVGKGKCNCVKLQKPETLDF